MLIKVNSHPVVRQSSGAFPARQRGVVLMISLVVLVVMTIGALALIRVGDTSSILVGNLAFQQAATRAAEAGTEDAVRMLENSIPATLFGHDSTKGYSAFVRNPDPLNSSINTWDKYWRNSLNPNPVALPVTAKTCVDQVCTLPTDATNSFTTGTGTINRATGTTVSYAIQRLCQNTGDPLLTTTGCAVGSQKSALSGGSLGSGNVPLPQVTQYYYRITMRVVGPRNTVSYVQAIVAR